MAVALCTWRIASRDVMGCRLDQTGLRFRHLAWDIDKGLIVTQKKVLSDRTADCHIAPEFSQIKSN